MNLTAAERRPMSSRTDSSSSSRLLMRSKTPFHLQTGWKRLAKLLQSKRMALAVILIAMAAVVKGSVEEILPFHADHRWDFDPMMIGNLFLVIATAYIVSAAVVGRAWEALHEYRIVFSAAWLTALGISAYCVLVVASYEFPEDQKLTVLYIALSFYGVCLGLTHTPSALLLADAIEREEGQAKHAVDGIWNTMWEAGGSLGFLLGGLLAHNYEHQLELLVVYAVCCLGTASCMLAINHFPRHWKSAPKQIEAREGSVTYGSTEVIGKVTFAADSHGGPNVLSQPVPGG